MMKLWVEKYRPQMLDDVFGQTGIVKRLKSFVKNKNLPHLLFAGPAGTGKTTSAMCIARELYGEEWHSNFLETNASDERGIDVIRGKIKDFARTMPLGDVNFKLILLDEADALTKEAQHALRRTMETYATNCRFILDCNFSSKIIDPIQSRCAVFRFKPLLEREVIDYLKEVSVKEDVKPDESALKALYQVSHGDLRKALNILQSCGSVSSNFNDELVYEVASYAQPKELSKVITLALSGSFKEARALLLDVMLKYGLSGIDAVNQLESLVMDLDLPDKIKVKLIDRIGEYEFRMVEGADEYLQLDALLAQLFLIGRGD
ncbi:MAG TPA: replication factor C small subunit [Candidatus Nanoarchaeia archaeon]|nr:replication factor C small subunit [Candidatus Nanoarchaeia archaeon]